MVNNSKYWDCLGNINRSHWTPQSAVSLSTTLPPTEGMNPTLFKLGRGSAASSGVLGALSVATDGTAETLQSTLPSTHFPRGAGPELVLRVLKYISVLMNLPPTLKTQYVARPTKTDQKGKSEHCLLTSEKFLPLKAFKMESSS